MWGSLLSSLASTLLPFAAKKLATVPLANQIFKTISPIMSTVMPEISKAFENNEETPVVVIEKETIESEVEDDDTPDKVMKKPKKYGKIKKRYYANRKNYL